ncbi:hypothetical protein LSM04_001086 [Trypanosoma melophagium]|uniref:uncharacterized protein n=1 Tax=Trypanosoma melophagium TaxID=715481 RepID=UPI00351A12F6|nr:hypothetical protein LSM04_001086 [Trypanosoma melophagium]
MQGVTHRHAAPRQEEPHGVTQRSWYRRTSAVAAQREVLLIESLRRARDGGRTAARHRETLVCLKWCVSEDGGF